MQAGEGAQRCRVQRVRHPQRCLHPRVPLWLHHCQLLLVSGHVPAGLVQQQGPCSRLASLHVHSHVETVLLEVEIYQFIVSVDIQNTLILYIACVF